MQVSNLSRKVTDTKESEARARQDQSKLGAKVAAVEDEAGIALKEAKNQERSLRAELQVRSNLSSFFVSSP